jgi:hypothetical protein
MENKYYTPTIEEFHVGFEYEVLSTNTDNIMKWIPNAHPINEDAISILLNHKAIRVNYLDKDDIESLGGVNLPDTSSFDIGVHQIYFQDYEFVEVYDELSRIIFQGKIKNKSELKRLLTMLNIK